MPAVAETEKTPLLEADAAKTEVVMPAQPAQPAQPVQVESEKKNILALAEQEQPPAVGVSKWALLKCLCKSGRGAAA